MASRSRFLGWALMLFAAGCGGDSNSAAGSGGAPSGSASVTGSGGAIAVTSSSSGEVSTSTTSGSGGSAGSGAAGGSGGVGTGGSGGAVDTTASGSGTGGGAACVGHSEAASPVPLEIIVLLDRSGSMSTSLWNPSRDAIKQFVNDPASAGTFVGLSYFPNDQIDDCDPQHYENLAVGVGELPAHAPAIASSLNNATTTGSTPTYGALKGTLAFAAKRQDAEPARDVIVMFISDGDPNGCSKWLPASPPDDHDAIAALAAKAFNYNGVKTYAFILDSAAAPALNKIASAGGTGSGVDVSKDISQFSAKISEVRKAAIACEFVIPAPPPNEQLDYDMLNVEFETSIGTTLKFPKVASEAACKAGAAWYLDAGVAPKKFHLCPSACNMVVGDDAGSLQVRFGCPSNTQ